MTDTAPPLALLASAGDGLDDNDHVHAVEVLTPTVHRIGSGSIHRVYSTSRRPPTGWLEHLRTVANGPYFPVTDQDQPRDFQAEMHIGALVHAGCFHTEFLEPDVVAYFSGQPMGLAVKRPRSAAAIQDRVRSAVDQLTRASLIPSRGR